MTTPAKVPARVPRSLSGWLQHPLLHLASLAALAGYFLVISWRRWPDLIIDFGRELYIPWRLSEGAVLYRDVDDFYGPLSQYLNAGLFRLFGPGLMVLALANLVVFSGIVVAIYVLFRTAWGALAAWISAAVFVAIFGMSRLMEGGNFNYITPYAHETTHGMLVLLALVAVLWRWSEAPNVTFTVFAGGLFGLALVLKPEIIFPGAALTACAAMFVWRDSIKHCGRLFLVWVVSAITPTALFALYFLRHFSFSTACAAASRAWLNVVATSNYVADPVQLRYIGLDAPAAHLAEHAGATVLALVIFALIAALGWLADRASARSLPIIGLIFALPTILLLSWSQTSDGWMQIGRCLLGLQLLYLAAQVTTAVRRRLEPTSSPDERVQRLRFLLALLAVTLLARMALNGRINHFGYYQAAIAAVMLPAIAIRELPEWARVGHMGRNVIAACTLALIVPCVVLVARLSLRFYQTVNYPIGEGRDQFFVAMTKTYPLGPTIDGLVKALREAPPGETLLVLPEGLMLNYLARMPSPLPHFFYYSVVTENGREKDIVTDLARSPPNWVVCVARSLDEYGIGFYGERSGAGYDILSWVILNYDRTGRTNGRPLELSADGAIIFRKKAPSNLAHD